MEQITSASARAATLIRQLLMFSRKQVMQFRHLDLNDTLRNAIKMLERLVGEHVRNLLSSSEPVTGHPCRQQHDGTNRHEPGGQRPDAMPMAGDSPSKLRWR